MPQLSEMTPEEREKLIRSMLTQALDAFQKGTAPAEEVVMAISAFVNVRLGEAIRMVNESLEHAIFNKRDDGDPRKTFQ